MKGYEMELISLKELPRTAALFIYLLFILCSFYFLFAE